MRYPPLNSEDMTPRQREVSEAIAQARSDELAGLYAPLIYSPEIAARLHPLAEYLHLDLRIPERLRVLAILMTAHHKNADVAAFARMENARGAGLSESTIAALSEGLRPEGMTADEAIIYEFCGSLLKTGRVKDPIFDRLRERFGREIALQLVALCGTAALLAVVLNVTRVSIPA